MTGILRGAKDEITTTVCADMCGEKIKFNVTYKRRDVDSAEAAAAEVLQGATNRDDGVSTKRMADLLREDVVRWDRLKGEGDTGDVVFNDENFEAALSIHAYRVAMYEGWNNVQLNKKGLSQKN